MRRITLERAEDEPLEIITDLLDADRYPANDLLELVSGSGDERVPATGTARREANDFLDPFFAVALQGVMQIVTIIVMARLATGV